MTNTITVALNKTVISGLNMRQGDVDVSDLVASMTARIKKGLPPLIQNLSGLWQLDANGKPTNVVEIHVGGRRLRALNQLADAKIIKKTFAITVAITESRDEAIIESSEENDARLPPHPLEQFENFARMIEAGHTPADVAARFNIGVDRVNRRMKLAKVSPRLLALYRADEIAFEQVAAFTLTDDHAAQEAAYFDQPEGWQRGAAAIRKALTAGEVDATTNKMAKFVGLDAYREAGGAMRQDLFSLAEDAGFIQDIALLQRLTGDKLASVAAEVEGEGWKWVRVQPDYDYQEIEAMGRVYPEPIQPSPEALAQAEALTAEYHGMEVAGLGETEEGAEAMDALSARIDALNNGGEAYREDDKALAGVLVYLDSKGEAAIRRGLIAVADKKAHAAMVKARNAASDDAGSKADGGTASEQAETAASGLSATLRENLSAHHTMALRASLIDNPTVALVATVHRMLLVGHYTHQTGARDLGAIRLEGLGWNETLDKHVSDIRETTAGVIVAEARNTRKAILPAEAADLWDYLIALPQSGLLDLLAYAASYQVFAVQAQYAPTGRTVSGYQLAEALALDMADYWTPTVPGYFGRVGKPDILEAVREVKGDEVAAGLASQKKGEMAEAAADLLADSRWVPAMLRTNGVESASVPQDEAEREAEARQPSEIPEAA